MHTVNELRDMTNQERARLLRRLISELIGTNERAGLELARQTGYSDRTAQRLVKADTLKESHPIRVLELIIENQKMREDLDNIKSALDTLKAF